MSKNFLVKLLNKWRKHFNGNGKWTLRFRWENSIENSNAFINQIRCWFSTFDVLSFSLFSFLYCSLELTMQAYLLHLYYGCFVEVVLLSKSFPAIISILLLFSYAPFIQLFFTFYFFRLQLPFSIFTGRQNFLSIISSSFSYSYIDFFTITSSYTPSPCI